MTAGSAGRQGSSGGLDPDGAGLAEVLDCAVVGWVVGWVVDWGTDDDGADDLAGAELWPTLGCSGSIGTTAGGVSDG